MSSVNSSRFCPASNVNVTIYRHWLSLSDQLCWLWISIVLFILYCYKHVSQLGGVFFRIWYLCRPRDQTGSDCSGIRREFVIAVVIKGPYNRQHLYIASHELCTQRVVCCGLLWFVTGHFIFRDFFTSIGCNFTSFTNVQIHVTC